MDSQRIMNEIVANVDLLLIDDGVDNPTPKDRAYFLRGIADRFCGGDDEVCLITHFCHHEELGEMVNEMIKEGTFYDDITEEECEYCQSGDCEHTDEKESENEKK